MIAILKEFLSYSLCSHSLANFANNLPKII